MLMYLVSATVMAGTFDGTTIDAELVDSLVRDTDAERLVGWADCSDGDTGCVSIDVTTTKGARTWVVTDDACTGGAMKGCYNGYSLIGALDHKLETVDLATWDVALSTDIYLRRPDAGSRRHGLRSHVSGGEGHRV